jgi:hypothetical protein
VRTVVVTGVVAVVVLVDVVTGATVVVVVWIVVFVEEVAVVVVEVVAFVHDVVIRVSAIAPVTSSIRQWILFGNWFFNSSPCLFVCLHNSSDFLPVFLE